jgi:hypothetical protein
MAGCHARDDCLIVYIRKRIMEHRQVEYTQPEYTKDKFRWVNNDIFYKSLYQCSVGTNI